MSFEWPHLLWLLAAPLALLGWEFRHRRRVEGTLRPKILRAEAGPNSLLVVDPARASRRAADLRPRYWLAAGLGLAVIALARPQWGRLEEPVFDQAREILLAVDLSRSMLTPDVKPSRLARTKLLIQSLLEKLGGERVGLVVFSGTSFLQAPLSADYEILREFLPALGPDFLPEGGTNYGAMLDTALQAFGTASAADRFLIVLSDGEATDTDWKSRFEELKKKNVRVLGLGVGTAGGDMIPDGTGGLVKDDRGAVVLSKLESATLQELARATGGTYRDASTWLDLAGLVDDTIAAGRQGEFVEQRTVRLVERFQWPLAFAVWCLLVSFYHEFPVRPKPRQIALRRTPPPAPPPPAMKPTAAPTAGAALVVLCAALALASGPAPVRAQMKLAPGASSGAPAAPSPATPPAVPAPGGNPGHSAPAPAPAAPAEPPPLAKMIGRLSAAATHTARDWAELGRETVTWGSRVQSQGQPVPEGPVRDALQATELGAKLDPKATDWTKLRDELEALLKKPDEDKQEQKDQKQQQQKQDQSKDQQKQQQDQKSENQEQQEKSEDQQQSQPQQSQPSDEKSPQSEQQNKPEEPKPTEDKAFGDMTKKDEPPPPPPENMQKVGGQPEKKEGEPKEQIDPALALPLQKLEQLRNQDSPAHLFQLMEGEKKPTKKTGKDW